jgi:nitroreductase
MTNSSDQNLLDFALTLMHSRQNILPAHLNQPGPSAQQLQDILGAAAAAPDHRQLLPWRFVIVPQDQRTRLGELFALALLDRDPSATSEQVAQARDKAQRSPFLMLAVAKLNGQPAPEAAAHAHGAHHFGAGAPEVNDAQRLVSLGCAIHNIVLSAHAAGFGTGLTSGQALTSPRLRALFELEAYEQAVCWINLGTVCKHASARVRPTVADYVSELS